MPLSQALSSLSKTVHDRILVLNVFDSRSTDPVVVRRQILATRLFLGLLLTSIVILVGYTFISVQTKSETITSPTQSVYEDLQRKYADSLQCPCSKLSIPYGKFVRVVPSFHQVCSSDFVSQAWFDFTFAVNTTVTWPIDIRRSLSAMWQLIGALCRTATNTTLDALDQFANISLVSSMIVPETLLKAKIERALDLRRQTASGWLSRPLTLLQRIVQVNELVTGLATNYIVVTPYFGLAWDTSGMDDDSYYIGMFGNRYVANETTTPCTCQNNGSCPISANLYLYDAFETYGIYDLSTLKANATLPGLVVDCFPLKMVLASSLECFYDQSCLQVLFTGYAGTINISVLDRTQRSRFYPTTKVQSLINELFIEQIDHETMFDKYYLECAPISCRYVYSRRFDYLYAMTTLLALFGGLSTAFRLAAPRLITLVFSVKNRRFAPSQSQLSQRQPIQIRLRNLLIAPRKALDELNIFSGHLHDPARIHHGRLATRLYIILFTISVSVLIVYSSTSIQLISHTVDSPMQEQYEQLYEQYGGNLQCPCTVVSMPYEEFLQLTPAYHQVCFSDFVQPWWYGSIVPLNLSDVTHSFLSSASSYFRAIAAFCEIANLTIIDTNRQFASTVFLNTHALPYRSFALQTDVIITTFIRLTRASFLHTLSSINAILHGNQYVSNLMSSTVLARYYIPELEQSELGPVRIGSFSLAVRDEQDNLCYCILNASCNLDTLFMVNGERYPLYSELPGLHLSCSVANSLLASSMMCWYNESCIAELYKLLRKAGISNIPHVHALDRNRSSRYSTNTTTEAIFNEIMVEQWISAVSYRKFYQTCHPAQCSYTYEGRSSVIYIVTLLIGLFGGLNVILRLISPFVVNMVLHCTDAEQTGDNQEGIDPSQQVRFPLLHRLGDKLMLLNLFDSESTERLTTRREQSSTRLYLILLFTGIVTVTIYTCLQQKTSSVLLPYPSQSQYEELVTTHSRTLQCPCTQISVPYEMFLTIDTHFHQVCSSDFVSVIWQQLLLADHYWYERDAGDFRVRGMAYFVFLSTLCTLSKTTMHNAVDEFLAERFISSHLLPEAEFHLQITSLFEQFKATTLEKFSRTLRLIHEVTHANAFVSTYALNWFWWLPDNSSLPTISTRAVRLADECSCGTRSDCTQAGAFYFPYTTTVQFTIPGWRIGCSPAETLLRSTLECFYNQTCVNSVLYYATLGYIDVADLIPIVNISAMNSTVESRFRTDTVIQDIVDQLFVERLDIGTSYASFYNQCVVASCSYTIEQRNAFADIFSQVLGLYGGLTVSLRFIVPHMIKLAFKARSYCCVNSVSALP